MPSSRTRRFAARFDPIAWEEDLARSSPAGREAAEAARKAYARDGVPVDDLRRVDREGRDGTRLPNCAKVYIPLPAGRFGMVFRVIILDDRPALAYLAFGVRHQPAGSRRPTVYQLAHRRLHGDALNDPDCG